MVHSLPCRQRGCYPILGVMWDTDISWYNRCQELKVPIQLKNSPMMAWENVPVEGIALQPF